MKFLRYINDIISLIIFCIKNKNTFKPKKSAPVSDDRRICFVFQLEINYHIIELFLIYMTPFMFKI